MKDIKLTTPDIKIAKPKVENMIFQEDNIFEILSQSPKPTPNLVGQILKKAEEKNGLNLSEIATLLNVEKDEQLKQIFKTATKVKQEIYGNRLVLFAPLYISSFCVNDCEYCGFHRRNKALRKKLTLEEIIEQVRILEDMGHKRLLLEFGEHPIHNSIDYITEVIKAIYSVKKGRGEIRRVNVNIAATSVADYKKLKQAGIGTYQLFQETYHRETYQKLHNGPKADYFRQLYAMDRAFEAGLDDLGIGVLYGLYDYKFEVLALVSHAQYLDKKYGVGPHTISVPRFRPAETVTYKPGHQVSDKDFLKIIAVLRLAVPYTGMIISTRETPEIRRKAFQIGISQTSAASKTSPGGYSKEEEASQFNLYDHRSLDEVVYDICQLGYLPSFCTACYRSKRTGERFMELAKIGEIQYLCQPNALQTFKEYLMDYASETTRKVGEELIKEEVGKIENKEVKNSLKKRLAKVEAGERDLYF